MAGDHIPWRKHRVAGVSDLKRALTPKAAYQPRFVVVSKERDTGGANARGDLGSKFGQHHLRNKRKIKAARIL